MNFIWSSAEISKTPSYRQLLHWWHYAVTEAVMATTILPNFKLRDLGTSPFYYEINNTRPARSERGKRDLQYSQVWCLSGLYWTRYSYSKTQKLLRNISDVRKVLPWVPEVFLACGGNFRCSLDRNWNRARKVSGTQGRKVCGNPRISWQIFKFLNSYIFFNIGTIDTNLEIFANRNVLFLTMWVLCCLSHNTRTRTQLSLVWN